MDFRRQSLFVKSAPESIRPALKSFYLWNRAVLTTIEFRWDIFQHIPPDNVPLLDEYLTKLMGKPYEGTSSIRYYLQDKLNDDEWHMPPWDIVTDWYDENESAAMWERHRIGLADVWEYLQAETEL